MNQKISVQPKIYTPDTHNFAVQHIDPYAIKILKRLTDAGFESYLVGGSVRDILLGFTPKDYDISTAAKPEEIKSLFRNCILIGRRFRLAHIRFGKKIFEVSTFRKGDIEHDELIVRDNEWGSAEEDVMRRDFTINGLYYDPLTHSIIDYVGGYEDLKKQELVAIGNPYLRFRQDPVRMIRLLKFQARFGLNIADSLKVALLDTKQEILKSSQARIFEEILRMLESGHSKSFFVLLAETGLLSLLLPTLAFSLEQDKELLSYSFLEELDYLRKEYPHVTISRALLLSALCYETIHHQILKEKDQKGFDLHLGEVYESICDTLHNIFSPFFQLPKKLKSQVCNILTTQYRFTPLSAQKRKIPRRFPKIPDFILALKFLNLRQRVEPGLHKIFMEWNTAYNDRLK